MSEQKTKLTASAVKVVSVFGSSKTVESDPEYQRAVETGRLLAQNGYAVCNGGYKGIMEAASRGAHEAGGKTIGITTEQFPGKVNRWIQEERSTPSWDERLFGLIQTADAFVLFNGGTGTLVEFFVTWEMNNKKMLQKPMIIMGDFLKDLLVVLKKQHDVVFNEQIKIAKTPEDVIRLLKT